MQLYKRETEGSRKKGGDKGKRSKNIPATLKGTGKSKNGALKRRKVKNCLRQRGFLISREMARSIINFFKSPTIKKRKTIVQRQKGQEIQKKPKSFERKTRRSAERRGDENKWGIVKREEKSAKIPRLPKAGGKDPSVISFSHGKRALCPINEHPSFEKVYKAAENFDKAKPPTVTVGGLFSVFQGQSCLSSSFLTSLELPRKVPKKGWRWERGSPDARGLSSRRLSPRRLS